MDDVRRLPHDKLEIRTAARRDGLLGTAKRCGHQTHVLVAARSDVAELPSLLGLDLCARRKEWGG